MVVRRLHDHVDRYANGPVQSDFTRRGAAGPVLDVFADGHSPLYDDVHGHEGALGQFSGILGSFAHEVRGQREDADYDFARSSRYARADPAVRGVLSGTVRKTCACGICDLSAGESRVHGTAAHPGQMAKVLGVFWKIFK